MFFLEFIAPSFYHFLLDKDLKVDFVFKKCGITNFLQLIVSLHVNIISAKKRERSHRKLRINKDSLSERRLKGIAREKLGQFWLNLSR